eukprot:6394592-Amphidinium_carterae.1
MINLEKESPHIAKWDAYGPNKECGHAERRPQWCLVCVGVAVQQPTIPNKSHIMCDIGLAP